MVGIINLLPDSVANQIAAGEVVQRPASVVKELVENAIDSGAGSITVNIKDAGKTLIQIIDNGCGMSPTDARLCWERHATSKIKTAADLFSIRTKGFRGEALASIAAVAEVNLKTRRQEDELGTSINISGSELLSNEAIACQAGSNFIVKNLFFNVPGRRKFLKADSTELRHIINEFNHIALAHAGVKMTLIHNDTQLLNLQATNLKQRITSVFGKNINQSLIQVDSETTLIKIKGFIGKPEFAKKTFGEQFFFVNGRYIRHPYFHKAVIKAYENILHNDALPSYFIFFDINPDKIDINIHPTKTEIKFEDEHAIWQILHAVVRESIGKNNLSPSIDFDNEGIISIPVLRKDIEFKQPDININKSFNPFDEDKRSGFAGYQKQSGQSTNWETLYNKPSRSEVSKNISESKERDDFTDYHRFMQLKGKYILSPVKSGLMIIDQKRAHERVLYEQNLVNLKTNRSTAQQCLFPETFELNHSDFVTFVEILDDINKLGFDIRQFGKNTLIVNGIPEYVKFSDLIPVLEQMLENYKSLQEAPGIGVQEKIAGSMAKASSISYGKVLEMEEMRELVDKLFACSNPRYSPSGKPVLGIIESDEMDKLLK